MKNKIVFYEELLKQELSPQFVEIIDDSLGHAGHGNFSSTHPSHLIVRIKLGEKHAHYSLIQRHRLIYNIFQDRLTDGSIHALRLVFL